MPKLRLKKKKMDRRVSRKFDREYGAYLVGESMDSISMRLGLCRSAVGRAFRRRKFKKRPHWIANEEQRELIRLMYDTGDYYQRELAEAFGYKSYVSIGQIIRRND